MHNSMAVSASTLSWHHSLYELMTLEKSSIGPRLEVATPLTRWKHAFSMPWTGLHVCVRSPFRANETEPTSVIDEGCEGKFVATDYGAPQALSSPSRDQT